MATADNWSDEYIIAEGRKYPSRTGLARANQLAYNAAKARGLLNTMYPGTGYRNWLNDNDVVAEGRKYPSRVAFMRANSGAYTTARNRNLLDYIGFPENNAPSDNNAIYIWRAVGQVYNGNPVYKIGVTSARLGIRRIEEVAKLSGFEFELISCTPVQCKATELESKLHLLGENPHFVGFGGCTEFRALTDSAMLVAIGLINSVAEYEF